MLAALRLTGVLPEVNLKYPLHTGNKACKPQIHPCFITQGFIIQSSKTGLSVAPTKRKQDMCAWKDFIDGTCSQQFFVWLPPFHPQVRMKKPGWWSGSGIKNYCEQVRSLTRRVPTCAMGVVCTLRFVRDGLDVIVWRSMTSGGDVIVNWLHDDVVRLSGTRLKRVTIPLTSWSNHDRIFQTRKYIPKIIFKAQLLNEMLWFNYLKITTQEEQPLSIPQSSFG